MVKKNKRIEVKGTEISISNKEQEDYICLTDIARYKDDKRTDYIIQNWLRNKHTIEYLGIWQKLYNPNFKPLEFEGFKNKAGLNSFVLTSKQWIEKTNAIKQNLIPENLNARQVSLAYATEADVLNMALYGKTAKQWREQNHNKKGNIRDYSNVTQLVCLANLENLNAVFITDNVPQSERLVKLNQIAISQMKILTASSSSKLIENE